MNQFIQRFLNRLQIHFVVLLIFIIGMFAAFESFAQSDIPRKTNDFVNDYAGILNPNQKDSLRALCKSIEREFRTQIAVITVKKLPEGRSIEEFTLDIAHGWGIGKGGQDLGVLFLIAQGDKKARIEVGYGLESIFTDAFASSVMRYYCVPQFRKGDYYNGLYAGIMAMSGQLKESRKEIGPALKQEQLEIEASKSAEVWTMLYIVIGFFSFIGLGWFGLNLLSLRGNFTEKREKLRKIFEKKLAKLSTMNGWEESRSVIDYLNQYYAGLKFTGTNYFKLEEETEEIEKAIKIIKEYSRNIESKWDEKIKIETESEEFKKSKGDLLVKYNQSSEIITELSKYKLSDYKPYQRAIDYVAKTLPNLSVELDSIDHAYSNAVSLLKKDSYQQASEVYRNVKLQKGILEREYKSITDLLKNAVESSEKLKDFSENDSVSIKLDKVTHFFSKNSSLIKSSLKNEFFDFSSNIDLFNPNYTNVIKEALRLDSIMADLENFHTQAKKQVNRQNDYYNNNSSSNNDSSFGEGLILGSILGSTLSSSSSSFGGSSSIDNSTSFGGGKFGGGGSSGSW